MKDETKDRRINIRLDEDTYRAIKKVVEKDLKTDISSYCRTLLWISTLHDATLNKIRNAVERFGKETTTDNMEYMLSIREEIRFMDRFMAKMKEDRKQYDEFISMMEQWHETIKNEALKYYDRHNETMDRLEKEIRESYGDDYDTDPTISKPGGKIIL